MLIALTREVSPVIAQCELTHRPRMTINVTTARQQHRVYEETLARLGCQIVRVPAARELPDSVFIEDTCIVLDELAIITRPGAASRQAEVADVAETFKRFRAIRVMESPATMDGGDVLVLGKRVLVGLSSRTNAAGLLQLQQILEPLGYLVIGVPLFQCLHLKSAVTQVAANTLLVNRQWVDPSHFGTIEIIDVDPGEPMAANALRIGDSVVYPTEFPRTRQRLEQAGIRIMAVDVSELTKAEGGVTCCSVVLSAGL